MQKVNYLANITVGKFDFPNRFCPHFVCNEFPRFNFVAVFIMVLYIIVVCVGLNMHYI